MRLQEERGTLDGCSVGAFAALRQTLIDQVGEVREFADGTAGRALAAEIIFQALAVGGLGKHAGKREFADAARAGEEHSLRNAPRAQSAAQRGDHRFIAQEFRKTHGYFFQASRTGFTACRHSRAMSSGRRSLFVPASKHCIVAQGRLPDIMSYISAASSR